MTVQGMPSHDQAFLAGQANLANAISQHVAVGWAVESQSATTAVMRSGSKPNHVLHLLLTLATCGLWALVWLIVGMTQRESRLTLTLNPMTGIVASSQRATSNA